MERSVELVYAFSESIEESVNVKYENTIINHKMLFWNIVDDELYPLGCNFRNRFLDFGNYQLAKSSEKYINKFYSAFNDDFCFISETAIDELASLLKMFDSYNLMFIIKDSQSDREYNYMIRAISNKYECNICIEIIDFDNLMDRSTTDFNYKK